MSSDTTPFGTSPFDPDPVESSRVEGGRHPLNVGQLVMGIAFLGLVGVAWAIEVDWIADADIRWLLPVPWVLAGLAGLLAIGLGSVRRSTAPEHGAPTHQSYAAPYATPESTPYPAPYPTSEERTTDDDTTVIPTENEEQDR